MWLNPAAGVTLWVDLESPSIPESLILSDTFAFHRLAVEDAMSHGQPPKLQPYDGYLFAVFRAADAEVDFFVGPTFLVTVHNGNSKAVAEYADNARHSAKPLSEGSVALFHLIADHMIDSLRPAIEGLGHRADAVEKQLLEKPSPPTVKELLDLRREGFDLLRLARSQRDLVQRLARREFVDISTEMAFRFRDVEDHLVRLHDDAEALADRVMSLLIVSSGAAGSRRWI